MEDHSIESIKVRHDLIGDFEESNKLLGYKAEMFLKKVLKQNEEFITNYLVEKYNLQDYIYILQPIYAKKYRKYLKDPESRRYIMEKYGDKQTLLEVVCSRITDLSANDCIRLKENYEEKENIRKLIESIVANYTTELNLIIGNDTKKKENL